ncbi:hypothetical protein GLOIN_2v1543550 [Rhizophagus clarus]|uniref:Uncharacterized protein n=1 Tax=Rhizophagus clarus TaxID=94130 RepID=A0A8H3LZF1_9GLOM|nr:hypothetical protein GLOIN_2v1543550 [Rhizophagus clarus]
MQVIINTARILQFACGLVCLVIDTIFLVGNLPHLYLMMDFLSIKLIYYVCVDVYCMLINGYYIITIECNWNRGTGCMGCFIHWTEIGVWIPYVTMKFLFQIIYYSHLFYFMTAIFGSINLFLSIICVILIPCLNRKITSENYNNTVNNTEFETIGMNNAGTEENNAGAEWNT